jgi:hypothetical protein
MNEPNKEKNNPLESPQAHNKLVAELKGEVKDWQSKAEQWRLAKVELETALHQQETKNSGLLAELEAERTTRLRERKLEIKKVESRQGQDFLTRLNTELDSKIQSPINR